MSKFDKQKTAYIAPVPMVIIRWYQARLTSIVKQWESAVRRAVFDTEVIPQLQRQLRTDDALDEFSAIKVDLSQSFEHAMPETAQYAEDCYGRTDQVHRSRWDNVLKTTYGVAPFLPEDWQSGFLKAFVQQNVSLMKSLSDDMLKRLESDILGNVRAGVRSSQMVSSVAENFNQTRKHARLIARDQTSKLYGQINQKRQEDIGVKRYEWSTSDDGRVRRSHNENDNDIMQWKNSNVYLSGGRWKTRTGYKGIPGQDIQCRCVALPIMPERV